MGKARQGEWRLAVIMGVGEIYLEMSISFEAEEQTSGLKTIIPYE